MCKTIALLFGLAAVVLVTETAWAPQAARAQTSPANMAAAGKSLFKTDCAVCHLSNGQGGMRFGDAVSANLTSPGLEQTYHHDDALIERAILQAKDEDGAPLDMPMPAWQGRLTAAQAAQIVAYLHTLHAAGG